MFLRITLLSFILFVSSCLYGQVYQHDFGTTTISTHPYTGTPTTLDVNLSNSSWSNSTNSWTSYGGSSGEAISLSNSGGTPTITLTFDIDAGCSLDITSFDFWRRRSSTGAQNWSMAINGTTVGSGTVPTSGSNIGNTTVTGMNGLTGTVTIVFSLSGASGTGTFRLDDFTLNGSTSCGPPCTSDGQPTSPSSSLNITNIGCFSMDLDWTSGNGSNRIVIASTSVITGTPTDQTDYTANASFGSGSTIAAGEFVVYNGNGNSFTITGLSMSTTYYFAVFEYNGTTANCTENYFTTSLTGNNTTTFCASTDPEITGILVAACDGNEGINEFFTFTNGTSSLDIDDLEVDFPSGGTFCNTSCGSGWVTNPSFVTQLNDTAGCPGLFIEGNPIPANAEVIVFTGANPTYDFNFSGLCGSGPYYAVFADNAITSGRFGNYNGDCSEYRTLVVDFGGSNIDIVTYQRCSLSGTGGDYVTFDAAGNPTYKSDGCTPSNILPIKLLHFKGKKISYGNLLEWVTTTEINNDYFTLERAEDGFNFIEIGIINGAGNSSTNQYYQFTDDGVTNHINYYRLKQTDFNGQYSYSNTIAISENLADNIYYNNSSNQLNFSGIDKGLIVIYNTYGQLIKSIDANQSKATLNLAKGMYIVTVQTANESFSKKIIVQQ
ncbi:MAG: T9SS type A sorting domain-containing protein [Flavobacteriales bacterium]|nr:T9SS type A sorting domain-containing protein [Flavobacteriales bacterium]MCB9362980.1 T9SS type A sorting domain-containing protein [Flavobacteriales bacterium]